MPALCSFVWVVICLTTPVGGANATGDGVLQRGVLVIDQSASFRPWPSAIIAGIRLSLGADAGEPISFYAEHLDFYRFGGSQYEQQLQAHFREKYRDRPIGVIVVIGQEALEYVLRLRMVLWSGLPVVFAAVDEGTVAKLKLPPDVTGTTVRMTLHDMIRAARALVPGLRRLAMVGDRLEQLPYYRHFASELATLPRELEMLDLMGLPIAEVRRRVAALPDHAAILYLGINREGTASVVAAEVLPLIAEVTQRPIVVNAETYLGVGGTGGFVMTPGPIGQEAGRLALRILNGEAVSSIPVSQGRFIRPIFDWQQLQHKGIAETMLPVGSEVRFRPRSIWDQYGWQVATITAVIVVQSALIVGLYVEHRRRRTAERLARERLAELAYMNRRATVGQLSASIAHEVSQPLTAIEASANAALRWLGRSMPDLDEAQRALMRIVDVGHRASGVVGSIRAMVKRGEGKRLPLDVNELVRSVLLLLQDEFKVARVALQLELAEGLPHVVADRIQLQQVIVNLVMNAIEAMGYGEGRPAVLRIASGVRQEGGIELVIEDSGPGIRPEDIDRIFEPFFTTKSRGMGMGLSICRSIVEAHDGRLWASAAPGRGAAFHVVLPVNDREDSCRDSR